MDTIIDLNRTNTDGNVLRTQIRRIWGVLTQPSFFFRQDFPTLGTSSLLTFGIANAWAASALSFFVQTMNSLLLSQLLDRWMRGLIPAEQAFSVWELSGKSFLYTAGALLLAPFLFLFQTFIFGSWLYFFSRLLIDPNRGLDDPTLIMRISDGAAVPGNRDVDEAERQRRIARFHAPYHRAVAEAIEPLEKELDVNVVTAHQAITWHALRRCGIDDRIEGFGRLMRES